MHELSLPPSVIHGLIQMENQDGGTGCRIDGEGLNEKSEKVRRENDEHS